MTLDALRRHLVIIVVVKLAILFAIWWLFVREARVAVATDDAARRILSSPGEPAE